MVMRATVWPPRGKKFMLEDSAIRPVGEPMKVPVLRACLLTLYVENPPPKEPVDFFGLRFGAEPRCHLGARI